MGTKRRHNPNTHLALPKAAPSPRRARPPPTSAKPHRGRYPSTSAAALGSIRATSSSSWRTCRWVLIHPNWGSKLTPRWFWGVQPHNRSRAVSGRLWRLWAAAGERPDWSGGLANNSDRSRAVLDALNRNQKPEQATRNQKPERLQFALMTRSRSFTAHRNRSRTVDLGGFGPFLGRFGGWYRGGSWPPAARVAAQGQFLWGRFRAVRSGRPLRCGPAFALAVCGG